MLLLKLLFFLLTVNEFTYGLSTNEAEAYLTQLINNVKNQLEKSDSITDTNFGNVIYETNIWDEPSPDFYHPYAFNLYEGHRTEIVLQNIFKKSEFEDVRNLVDMTIFNAMNSIFAIWYENGVVSLGNLIETRFKFDKLVTPNVFSLDYVMYYNTLNNEPEHFIIVASGGGFKQKLSVFKIDFGQNFFLFQSEIEILAVTTKIRVVPVPGANKNLLVAVRYMDIAGRISCNSEVFEMKFVENRLVLFHLQFIRTSAAVDAEPFSINGVTYLAIANSLCQYSDVHVFDAAINGFYLYQRLPVHNSTDFQYFNLGFRHFLATTGLTAASIFEWEGEFFTLFQDFEIGPPSHPTRDVRQWHKIRTPWKSQTLLLLVKSLHEIDLIKWSNMKQRFSVEHRPVCYSWVELPNLVGHGFSKADSFKRLSVAQELCILDERPCLGLSQFLNIQGEKEYVPEFSFEKSNIVPSEKPGYAFWLKTVSTGFSCLTQTSRISATRIVSYSFQDLIFIILPFETHASLLNLGVRLENVAESSFESFAVLQMSNLENFIDDLYKQLEYHRSRPVDINIVSVVDEQYFVVPVFFNTTVTVASEIDIENLAFTKLSGKPTLSVWDAKFGRLSGMIKRFFDNLNDAIYLNDSGVHIDQNMHFTNLEIQNELISSTTAEVTTINRVPVVQFMKSVVTNDFEDVIIGRKIFMKPIQHIGNVRVNHLVAGHRFPEDLLTTSTEQTLFGQWYFDQSVEIEHDLHVTLLNEVRFWESVSLYTLNQSVIHSATKIFTDNLLIEGDVYADEVNGIDLKRLWQVAVRKTGNQKILAPKIFKKNVHVLGNVNMGGNLNGHNIRYLDSVIVKRGRPTNITGLKTFTNDVVCERHVELRGYVNGHKFPNGFVRKGKTVLIEAPKIFMETLILRKNLVVHAINGISPRMVVTLDTDQEIKGLKVFHSGLQMNNLTIGGTIDGMTVENLHAIDKIGRLVPKIPDYFSSFKITGDLNDVERVNGLLISELTKVAVSKGNRNVTFNEEMRFIHAARVVGDVKRLKVINHFNLETDFLTTVDKPREVKARKIFRNRVTFREGFDTKGLIDGVNLNEFRKNVVTLDSLQNISGNLIFVDGITILGSVMVKGLIDGVKIPDEVIFKDLKSQDILATKIFRQTLKSKTLSINDLHVEQINRINWRRFQTERVTLTTPQEIYGPITFANDVRIGRKFHVLGRVNDVNVRLLTNDAMLKSKSQVITGRKTFTGHVTATRITTESLGLNRINFTELNTRIVRIHENVISQPLVFHEVKMHHSAQLTGQLNGIAVDQLLTDAILKNDNAIQIIEGGKFFPNGLVISGDLEIKTINGIKPTMILSRHLTQVVEGRHEYRDIIVEKSITANQQINNVDIVKFRNEVLKTNENVKIPYLIVQHDMIVDQHLIMTGLINDINLNALIEESIRKTGRSEIMGHTEFKGPVVIENDLHVQMTVNNIKLSEFVTDIIMITDRAEITGKKTFLSEVTITNDLLITGNLSVVHLVNGVDINLFKDSIIYLDLPSNITGKKTFLKKIIFKNNLNVNRVNNISIPEGMVLKHGSETIFGTKTFKHVIVKEDIKGKRVNNYVLKTLYDDTMFIGSALPIRGTKILKKPTTFKEAVHVLGKTCGMTFHQQVMTVDTTQEITGTKTMHTILVTGDAEIRALNLSRDLWNAIYKPKEYLANYYFKGSTTFLSEVELRIPQLSLPPVENIIRNLSILKLDLRTTAIEGSAKYLSVENATLPLKEAAIELSNFESLGYFNMQGYDFLKFFEIKDTVYQISRLKDRDHCQTDSVFAWNEASSIFYKTGDLSIKNSSHFNTFTLSGHDYVIGAQANSYCGSASEIFRYDHLTQKLQFYCKLPKYFFHKSAILIDHNTVYIATVPNLLIIKLDIAPSICTFSPLSSNLPHADIVEALKGLRLFVFGTRNKGISFYQLTDSGEIKLTEEIYLPGLQNVIAMTENEKHFLVITRVEAATNLQIIQVFRLTPLSSQDSSKIEMILLKQIPTDRKILAISTFTAGPYGEMYISVLYKKFGASIMKLEGYEIFDKVKVPIAAAHSMNTFTSHGTPYLILHVKKDTEWNELFMGHTKGHRLAENVICG